MTLQRIRRLSYAAGVVQLLMCISLISVGAVSVWNKQSGVEFFSSEYLHAVFALLVAFTFITAVFNLLVYPWYYNTNAEKIERGENPLRFVEYSITASIMIVVIAILSGVQDAKWLIALASASAITMIIGYAIEARFIPAGYGTFFAWVVLLAAYTSIFYRFAQVASVNTPPIFVYAIILAMFVLFCCFGLVQAIWLIRKREVGLKYETAYHILSLVAKTLLVLLTASGVPPMLE